MTRFRHSNVPRFPLSDHRYLLHSFPTPHSPGSERERHAHSAHFAPAKTIAVFWMIRQNTIALQEKTLNEMKIQNDDNARHMPLRPKVVETKKNEKIVMPYTHLK